MQKIGYLLLFGWFFDRAFIFRTGTNSGAAVSPAIAAIRTLLLTDISTAHITIHATPNLDEVPPSLASLVNNNDARMALLSLTHSIRTSALNRESKYYDTAVKYGKARMSDNDSDDEDDAPATTTHDSPLQVSNWAGGNDFKRFLSESDTDWIADVFMSVPDCKLSRNDLFHAHLVHVPAAQDIILAFHCKEYPADLEPIKSGQAVQMGATEFETGDVDFPSRNVIFSFARNRLFTLHFHDASAAPAGEGAAATANPFVPLLKTFDASLNVPQAYTMDMDVIGKTLADITYLPGENVQPFMTLY